MVRQAHNKNNNNKNNKHSVCRATCLKNLQTCFAMTEGKKATANIHETYLAVSLCQLSKFYYSFKMIRAVFT